MNQVKKCERERRRSKEKKKSLNYALTTTVPQIVIILVSIITTFFTFDARNNRFVPTFVPSLRYLLSHALGRVARFKFHQKIKSNKFRFSANNFYFISTFDMPAASLSKCLTHKLNRILLGHSVSLLCSLRKRQENASPISGQSHERARHKRE